MTENGYKIGADFDPGAVEGVALQIGARLRRYHSDPKEAPAPVRLNELLRELERAEHRL